MLLPTGEGNFHVVNALAARTRKPSRWVLPSAPDSAAVAALASELHLPPVICELLIRRGHDTPELAKRFKGNGWLSNTIGNPLDTTIAAACLIFGGVMHRHPKLKVAFLECYCGWVSFLLHRMDNAMEKGRFPTAGKLKVVGSYDSAHQGRSAAEGLVSYQ